MNIQIIKEKSKNKSTKRKNEENDKRKFLENSTEIKEIETSKQDNKEYWRGICIN